ncbi:M23 family metallopeptidase [Streptomyces buecherae]|uniref:M23 family metallopeptidase n=1 Tax=Streptomyces buecherae TaxID=2763006 RepID=UPI003678EF7F
MAFTRATGRHRRPSRFVRTSANAAGMATLAATGVVAGIAAPAMAAPGADGAPELQDTGLRQAATLNEDIADKIGAQADAQYSAAEQAAAEQQAEEEARQQAAEHAAEMKKKAEEAKRKAAAEAAKKKAAAKKAAEARAAAEREAEEARASEVVDTRASRTAERPAAGSYVLPVAGSYVSTQYQASGGAWSSGSHTGVDFHASTGTSVRAVGAGTIVEAGWGGAYGNNVVIKMNDGTYTQYGHLDSISVSVGQSVAPGEQIGLAGNTGNSFGAHLHFEARTSPEYGSDINPVAYLRSHGVNI